MSYIRLPEVYRTAQYVPIYEAHPLRGQSPYAASKIGADMIAESYWRSFGLPVAIIRPFNTVWSGPIGESGNPQHHRAGTFG